MAAYSDAAKIAAHLGVVLSASQIVQAGVTAQAASDWIDRHVGKSWQGASPTTGELQYSVGDRIYLDNRPVVAITSVETRGAIFAGSPWTALAASQYELRNPVRGELLIQGWGYYEARVSYTHTATSAPPVVGLAATMIAASWLGPTMVGLPSGLESIALGQSDIQVKFSSSARDVPAEALTLLASYRTVVIA